jgi:hypothetical protein
MSPLTPGSLGGGMLIILGANQFLWDLLLCLSAQRGLSQKFQASKIPILNSYL